MKRIPNSAYRGIAFAAAKKRRANYRYVLSWAQAGHRFERSFMTMAEAKSVNINHLLDDKAVSDIQIQRREED